jgi:hypothetical protein
MTPPRSRVTRWACACGLAALTFLVQIEAARAQFFDPFSQFFAPQAPTYAPQAPIYARPLVSRRGPHFSRRSRVRVDVPERAHVRQSRAPERVRHVRVPLPVPARIRSASLPSPTPVQKRRTREPAAVKEKVRDEGKTKLVPREPGGDPVAALMKDPTLRRGDVVVLRVGPKVFKGRRTMPHRLSDFEDVRRTRLVETKMRRQLTATPVQFSPSRVEPAIAERGPDKQDRAEEKQVIEQVSTTGALPRKVGP